MVVLISGSSSDYSKNPGEGAHFGPSGFFHLFHYQTIFSRRALKDRRGAPKYAPQPEESGWTGILARRNRVKLQL